MGLFDFKEVLAISWDSEGNVIGTILRQSRKGGYNVVSMEHGEFSEGNFSDAIKLIYDRLSPSESCFVILGGYIQKSVCIDLNVPSLTHSKLSKALEFELPSHIPVQIDEVVWGYRLIESDDLDKKNCVRVFICSLKSWNHFVSEIGSAGVKVDLIMSPYMAIDPVMGDQEFLFNNYKINIPDTFGKREISLADSVDGRENRDYFDKFTFIDDTTPEDLKEVRDVSLILGDYVFSGMGKNDLKTHLHVPDEIKPTRFRFFKISAVAMLILVLLLGLSLVGRDYWENYTYMEAIRKETSKVNRRLLKLNKRSKENAELDEVIGKVKTLKPGNPEIIHMIYMLSRKVPAYMYFTYLNYSNGKTVISIDSEKDSRNIMSVLTASGFFSTGTYRSSRGRNGRVRIYLTLPEKR